MALIHKHRLRALEAIVDERRLAEVWKETVRQGLRHQVAEDLHDYADVHFDLSRFAGNLREAVLSGSYRPREPDAVAQAKGKGLLRHLLLPSAADAVLLQALADAIQKDVLRGRPAPRSVFYSRSHRRPDIENLDSKLSYPWWVKWTEFIRRIWRFQKDYPCLVVTDLANYFDNIDLDLLRRRLTGRARINEAALDLMLHILRELKPKAFYGDHSAVGLPQIHFDAPRLLAMAYLYDADDFLANPGHRKRRQFVRWMDDIDFGAGSVEEAKETIGELDRRLEGLHVRLNAGKTRILSRREAAEYFWIAENLRLNRLKKRLEKAGRGNRVRRAGKWRSSVRATERSAKAFTQRVRRPTNRVGQWEKVYKRYIGLMTFTASTAMERQMDWLLSDCPALREKALSYLLHLGYRRDRLKTLLRFMSGAGRADHVSFCKAAEVVIHWLIPTSDRRATRSVRSFVAKASHAKGALAPAIVGSLVALGTKFLDEPRLGKLIRDLGRWWKHSDWALRQVAATLPLLGAADATFVLAETAGSGLPEGMRVTGSLGRISAMTALTEHWRRYLQLEPKAPYGYPMPKLILGIAFLRGHLPITDKQRLRRWLDESVGDELQLAILARFP